MDVCGSSDRERGGVRSGAEFVACVLLLALVLPLAATGCGYQDLTELRELGPPQGAAGAALRLGFLEAGEGGVPPEFAADLAEVGVAEELAELEAPPGWRWVWLLPGQPGPEGLAREFGRVLLARTAEGGADGDGSPLDSTALEAAGFEEYEGEEALRLRARPERRAELERWLDRPAGGWLLFVEEHQVLLAARFEGPLTGELLLLGVPEEQRERLLFALGRPYERGAPPPVR